MLHEQVAQDLGIPRSELAELELAGGERLAVHERGVEPVDVRGAARHAGAEVAAGRAEDHGEAAGHVLERVVADALDDGGRTGVAHEEPLADDAAQEHRALRRAVADHVAGDDVLRRVEGRVRAAAG